MCGSHRVRACIFHGGFYISIGNKAVVVADASPHDGQSTIKRLGNMQIASRRGAQRAAYADDAREPFLSIATRQDEIGGWGRVGRWDLTYTHPSRPLDLSASSNSSLDAPSPALHPLPLDLRLPPPHPTNLACFFDIPPSRREGVLRCIGTCDGKNRTGREGCVCVWRDYQRLFFLLSISMDMDGDDVHKYRPHQTPRSRRLAVQNPILAPRLIVPSLLGNPAGKQNEKQRVEYG